MRVKPVARLDALVEPFRRIAPLIGDHTPFTRTGRRTGHGRAARQRGFGLITTAPKTHTRDINRNIQLDRALGTRANDRFGSAFFAVALDHETRQRARHEGQIIPVRDFLEQGETAHAVAPKLGLDMNVIHHLRRKYE